MIERWTVDSLAGEIEQAVKAARPYPKMSKRWFRRGKRDGKRELDWQPPEAFLREAIQLATSKIAEDHLALVEGLKGQIAGLSAKKAQLEAALAEFSARQEANRAVAAAAKGGGAEDLSVAGTRRPIGDKARLAGAVDELKGARAEAERRALQAELDQVSEHLDAAEKALARAPDLFRQRVFSTQGMGSLLWASFCRGYEKGQSRRGATDDDAKGPDTEIEFEVPEVLVMAGAEANTLTGEET
jgi:hypothetical protein